MKIISTCFLVFHCFIFQASFGQSNYALFISKNEKALSETNRLKLEKEFQNPEFREDPNVAFRAYVQKNYPPDKGQQFSFYIIDRGHQITKHTISNMGSQQREQLTSLVSRGNGLEFYNLSDFENFFRDTLVIIDTVCLDFSKLNELSNDCVRITINGKTFNHVQNDSPILLTSAALNLQTGNYFASQLSCETNPHKIYSSTLFFLGYPEKEELKEFIKSVTADQSKVNLNETLEQVQSFISLRWGKCQVEDIHHWFRQN